MKKFFKDWYDAWCEARMATIKERLKTGHWE